MSSTDRQNRLLVTEDWKRIYQSFRNAEFQSYDFDNLRRTMINYLRENYPEDFNDYIESSEYLALIDMIAYLGQNISFRIDLNARENFLELAERRESVLRLARLLSYNPKRNQASNGLLKITAVSTTEEVSDSNNLNLRNRTIIWNDPANSNWNEQFDRVINAALSVNAKIGNPVKQENINGVTTQQYKLNSASRQVPVYGFTKNVDGRSVNFEVVSTGITNDSIVEEAPLPNRRFGFLYRNDGQGPSSTNTGYFSHFRQGVLDFGNFSVTNPSSNQVVAIDQRNINNSDVWLYSVNENGVEQKLWTKVDSVEGNNIIYNSIEKNQRDIYSVLTRIEDRISLIFADGTFGNLPQGSFRVYYRSSVNSRLFITPSDMRGIVVRIPYISRTGNAETLAISYSLEYTVVNGSTTETSANIKSRAPSTYYTQNRMVTGEDYQVAPLSISQEIVKAKAVNRTSSGISRYFDLIDATGKYSSTNLFGTDGALFKDFLDVKQSLNFENLTDIEGEIVNTVQPILKDRRLNNFYLDQFPLVSVRDLNNSWQQKTADTNQSTGNFIDLNGDDVRLGNFTESNMKFVKLNSLLKFEAPDGFHFLNGELIQGEPDFRGGSLYKWSKVVSIVNDGTSVQENEFGSVILNDVIPTGAKIVDIRTPLPNALVQNVESQAINEIFNLRTFGLRYDQNIGEWQIVSQNNLNIIDDFSTGKTGDTTGQQLDSSWLLLFETDGEKYTITYRSLRYIFESDREIRFYFDSTEKIFNNKSGKTVKDKVTVLGINTQPDTTEPFNKDFDWEVTKEFRNENGYVDSKKIEISFFDSDDDGVVDDPEIFDQVVNETQNIQDKLVFLRKEESQDGLIDYVFVAPEEINVEILQSKNSGVITSNYSDGQLFYFIEQDIFENLNRNTGNFTINTSFRAKIGRSGIKFHYIHNADENARIDPSASNIIDIYLLTRQYDTQFRLFLDDAIIDKPLPASSDNLFISFGQELNKIKTISDEIIYHSAKYKILFGNKATSDLQATFKIVKSKDIVINDNDLKSRVISTINRFFALENWDFGDNFYFSELASFVMAELSPDIITFVIVPVQPDQSFGSLYEIKAESDEIFISAATVEDIDIIDEITANRLNADGNVITSARSINSGIQSADDNPLTIGGPSTNGLQ
jgi:hypothetical protein